MPYVDHLYYEESGAGEPVVLVHGGFSDHSTWRFVVEEMPSSLRVVTYDRRGHSASARPPGKLTRRVHEDDLARLIETLELAPAHVVGNSYGASIVLGLAGRRPELFRGVVAHEAPLTAIVRDDPAVVEIERQIGLALERIEGGDAPGGVQQFLEEIALGRGNWVSVPEPVREAMIANAGTVLDEQRDPEWASLALDELAALPVPVLLTHGEHSPAWFLGVVEKLAASLPDASVRAMAGASHNPHATHPAEFAAAVSGFAAGLAQAPFSSTLRS
jgi:pimeloyl-ACP methyl ester carboxylesterase